MQEFDCKHIAVGLPRCCNTVYILEQLIQPLLVRFLSNMVNYV